MGTFWSPFLPVYPDVRFLISGGVPKKVSIWGLCYLGVIKKVSNVPRGFLGTFWSVLMAELMVLVNSSRLIHCVMIYCCGKNIWLEINKCCVMIRCSWVDPIPFDLPNLMVSGLVIGNDNRTNRVSIGFEVIFV